MSNHGMPSRKRCRVTELEYLRFVYNSLDLESLLPIYKSFPDIPPLDYTLLLCEKCEDGLRKHTCIVCSKYLCEDCAYLCESLNFTFCEEHFDTCPICEEGCVCDECKVCTSDSICSVCIENYEIEFSCGCSVKDDNRCSICNRQMDPITKERIK